MVLTSGFGSEMVARHVRMHGRGKNLMVAVLHMVALWRSSGLVVE